MNLAIIGCGDLGGRVAKLVMSRGDLVFGVRRDVSRLPDGVLPIEGDVESPDGFELPAGIHAMVYAVAASERSDRGYERAYPQGLGHALGILDRSGAVAAAGAPVVFVSSTAVYGEDGGQWVDEGTVARPERFNGVRMAEAEAVLAMRGQGTSLRLGGIYGPGRSRLIDSVRDGEPQDPTRASAWTNRIHVDDAARALVHVVDLHLGGVETPRTLNGVDEEPAQRSTVQAFIAEELGLPVPPSHGESRPPSNKRVLGNRLRGTGFEFLYPTYREGYSALLSATGK